MLRHPPSLTSRSRITAGLLILIAAMGCRRWIVHPWQLTLRHYSIVVAGCAVGLVFLGYPRPVAMFLMAVAFAVFVSLRLRRHGFTLTDIVTLLAIILVAISVLLPVMEDTWERTAGSRYFPTKPPQHFVELLYGRE